MMRLLISRQDMSVLIKAMIYPQIQYMCVVWGSAIGQFMKQIDTVIKAAATLVYGKKGAIRYRI